MLGIGAMGHGMATSALRAGHSDDRLEPRTRGDPRPRRAGRGGRRQRHRRGAGAPPSSSRWSTDADAVISIARDQGMLDRARPGCGLGADEHDRRGGDRPGRGRGGAPSVLTWSSSTRRCREARTPAAQGQLTIFASGPDEARSRVAPALRRRSASAPIWVGPVGAGSRARRSVEQHLARVRGRRRSPPPSPLRIGWGSRPTPWWTPSAAARSCLPGRRPSCSGSPEATSRPEFALSLALEGRAPRPPGGRRRTGSPPSPAWPTNGSGPSTTGSATRTSPSWTRALQQDGGSPGAT